MRRLFIVVFWMAGALLGQGLTSSVALEQYLGRRPSTCEAADQSVEMKIDAALPKLKKQGSMQGLKVISGSGQVAYRFLRFTGDKLVKTDVIARFLTAEAQPPEHPGNIAISRENYKIHFARVAEHNGARAYVYELRPRAKRTGLFKGELWLDATSGAPVRESGDFVKSPSVFVRKVHFLRDYRGDEVCAPPEWTSITVQTRVAGDAEMVVMQRPVGSDWAPPSGEGMASAAQN
jgi:hypothetical protein